MPDGNPVENLAAIVRSVANENGSWHAGCRFISLTPRHAEAIQFLVSLRIDQSDDSRIRDKRIPVIAPRGEHVAELRAMFEQQRFELVCVESAVEAMFLLRLQPPQTFLVGVETEDIAGTSVRSLVRKTKSIGGICLFLWGGPNAPVPEAMQNADAYGWIRSMGAADAVFKQVVQGINSRASRA